MRRAALGFGTALTLMVLALAVSEAVADVVALKSGRTFKGRVANREEFVSTLSHLTTISLLPSPSDEDSVSPILLRFSRAEVDYVVLEEDGREFVYDLSLLGEPETKAPYIRRSTIASTWGRTNPPSVVAGQGLRAWILLGGGVSSYLMEELNDVISDRNADVSAGEIRMEEVRSGPALSVMLGVDTRFGASYGVGFDHLVASSNVADFTGSLDLALQANCFRIFGTLPVSRVSASRAFVGASVGTIVPTGTVKLIVTGTGAYQDDLEGIGPLFEVFAGGDVRVSSSAAILLSVGYRHARLGDVSLDGFDWWDLDYSGGFVRAGMKLGFERSP